MLSLEYIEVFVFWLSLVVAGAASLIYLRSYFLKGESELYRRLAQILSWLTLIVISVVIGLQWERTGLHPFTGPFSAKVFYAASILFIFLAFELAYGHRVPRIRMVGVLVLPAVVLLLLIAWTQFEATPSLFTPNLRSFRVFIHVSTAIFAYGSFTIGTIFALIYLVQEAQLKKKRSFGSSTSKLPSLETAETATHRALGIGFVFSVALLLTGMFSAQLAWGRMWDWSEPREVSALVMTLAYAFYFFARDILGWRGRRSSYIAIVAFLIAVFTYATPLIFANLSRHRWGGF